MKVVAKNTIKNARGSVLFIGGESYEITRDGLGRNFVLNELHTKTPLKQADIDKYFIREREA